MGGMLHKNGLQGAAPCARRRTQCPCFDVVARRRTQYPCFDVVGYKRRRSSTLLLHSPHTSWTHIWPLLCLATHFLQNGPATNVSVSFGSARFPSFSLLMIRSGRFVNACDDDVSRYWSGDVLLELGDPLSEEGRLERLLTVRCLSAAVAVCV